MGSHRDKIRRVFELCEQTARLPLENRLGSLATTIQARSDQSLDVVTQVRHCAERLHRLAWYTEALTDWRVAFDQRLQQQRDQLEQRDHLTSNDTDAVDSTEPGDKTRTQILALSRPEMDSAACRMELLENTLDLDQSTRALLIHLSLQQQFMMLPVIPGQEPLSDKHRTALKQFLQNLPLSLTHLAQVIPPSDKLNKLRHNLDMLLLRLDDDNLNGTHTIKLIVPIWTRLSLLSNAHLERTLSRAERRLAVTRRITSKLRVDQKELENA